MKKIFNCQNIGAGYSYAYVHFVTEILCFYVLSQVLGDSIVLWLTPFLFDMLAFVPQSIFGYINDKHLKIPFGPIGIVLMGIGLCLFKLSTIDYIPIIIISIGNALAHVAGAEATLRSSNGNMRHAAFFVAGGTFGIILGKILGMHNYSFLLILLIILSGIPFSLIGDTYKEKVYNVKEPCKNYNYSNDQLSPMVVIIFSTFIVIARGYMGYGIPLSWNKTITQTIALYVTMGFGKALGGILVDTIGMRKTAFLSTIFSLPFLLFGDKIMMISIIGVMFFSMTMAISLGLIVSALKTKPGLAFGYTTIGLFLGTVPVFFIKTTNMVLNSIILSTITILCILILNKIIRRSEHGDNH